MATTPQEVSAAILTTATVLYNPFIAGGATRGLVIYLHFCNTTTADITIDVTLNTTVDKFILDDKVIPAKGTVSWSGCITLATATDSFDAIASATGVDCTGTVMENA